MEQQAIDTSLLQDEETGSIFMIYCHTPGGIGLWNSVPGVGFDIKGRKKLYDHEGKLFLLETDGRVLDGRVLDEDGQETDYSVDEDGEVFKGKERKGNIYLKQGIDLNESLLEERTSFLHIIQSDNDGLTWSKPRELNLMVKEEWMRFIGSGPGFGIQIKHGDKKGRLIFPIYFSNETDCLFLCLYL